MTRDDPSISRRRLRDAVRQAREKQQMTQRQAADRLDWSMSKLVRIEAGTVNVSTTDLKAMLQLYDVSDQAETDRLVDLARTARLKPWYSQYQQVLSPGFAQYLGYESSASVIRAFQPLTMPGLIQTDDYARAILEAGQASHIDERVDLRVARQELLDRDDCPDIYYVIDEAALHRMVGGPAAMRRQLRRIQEAAKHPKISIDIIPFSAGAHPAMTGSFSVIEFADGEEDVLYLETADGSVTSREDQQNVARFRERFDLLRAMSLNDQQANQLIDSLIDEPEIIESHKPE